MAKKGWEVAFLKVAVAFGWDGRANIRGIKKRSKTIGKAGEVTEPRVQALHSLHRVGAFFSCLHGVGAFLSCLLPALLSMSSHHNEPSFF